MGSHAIPRRPVNRPRSCAVAERRDNTVNALLRAEGPSGGSISFPLHPSLRRQGADLDTGAVPPGAGEGWLRRGLRLSVARRAGARLRRPRADRRDRRAASDDAALFAGPRRVRDRASRHERDFAPRRGGPGFLRGTAEAALGLGDEAVFVGQGHKFQIWEPTRFQRISKRRGRGSGACAPNAKLSLPAGRSR